MGLLSRLFGSRAPSEPVELTEVVQARRDLRTVDAWVDAEFPQCTKAEKRGMRAMRCNEIFRRLANAPYQDADFKLACSLIFHAWWIAGLVLQLDRKPEVARAIKLEQWRGTLGQHPQADALAAWAVTRGVLRSEKEVDAFSAEVWARLGLDPARRPAPP